MNEIIVANKRNTPSSNTNVYVGRPSPLGNPFAIKPGRGRETVVAEFRKWFVDKLLDPEPNGQKAAMAQLRDLAEEGPLTLVCWCAPLPCHADVIREILLEGE